MGPTLRVYSLFTLPDFKKIQIPIIPISDLELASANKLNKLAVDELIALQENYQLLKIEYQKHRTTDLTTPHEEQLVTYGANPASKSFGGTRKNIEEH